MDFSCDEVMTANPGETVQTWAEGTVAGAVSVGASVSGFVPKVARCWNKTTGQKVSLQLPPGVTSWDCEAEGLVVSFGDLVDVMAQGPAE